MRQRRSPTRNVTAAELIEFLDAYVILDVEASPHRSYLNNIWLDDNWKRVIRRYRNGHVRSIRPESLQHLLTSFRLESEWLAHRSRTAQPPRS